MIRSAIGTAAEAETIDDGDIIDWINEYFEDFENKVYTNRFVEIDKRITYLIIRKFKHLFEIWEQNAAFSKFLEGDSFREIFALMYNEFGFNYTSNNGSSGECYLECELCGEEIVLRNNDPEYSYRLHETSKYHLEFVRSLKAIRTDEEIDVIFNRNINEKGTFFECHLCTVLIPVVGRDENDKFTNARFLIVMDSHQEDEEHRLNMEIFASNKSHIKVHNMEEKLYVCSPCEQICHVDLLMDHLKNPTHVENTSKEFIPKKTIKQNDVDIKGIDETDFEVFKINLKSIHVIEDSVQCSLCESNMASVSMVLEHLTTKEHTQNLENYMLSTSAPAIFDQVDEVKVEEFPPKKEYQSRCSLFKSNYASSIYLVVVFSISVVFLVQNSLM